MSIKFDDMTFENNQSGNGGFISIHNDSEEMGRLTYTIFPNDNNFVISYVLVHSKFEGNGIGKQLVKQAIAFARENHWKVTPHCSYARSVMNRMEGIEDVFSLKNI